ncbi:DNA replication/repair protein RecF [Brevundimonas sp. CEF1]|uniref:DNA replication/repair protein RecF n=1 Tax=Brevundimonas sp. CEF1 TaxID=3442642 RepID=UPI003F5157F6
MITSLALTDFRSYASASLPVSGGAVVLHGPNGAGKTNLLEAISLLTPGKGLRGATAQEMGRREPGEAVGRAWAVMVTLDEDGEEVRLGTGVQTPGAARRIVRIDGETAPPGRLLDHLRPVWATPEQDRLFSDARAGRLRFFDRLVFAADPDHAATVSTYEKALRERLKLLTDGAAHSSEGGRPADPLWLDALEARLSEAGARAAVARTRALAALQAGIDARDDRPFPQADLGLTGPAEEMAAAGADEADVVGMLGEGFMRARGRDAAAGRSLFGPHRSDLTALHREKNRPAAEGSSGEQKALVLNLILAQVGRLAGQKAQPVLLLDEAPAHLDEARRAALFDEIEALGLQAFMTGTERGLFAALEGRAQFVSVEGGALLSPSPLAGEGGSRSETDEG